MSVLSAGGKMVNEKIWQKFIDHCLAEQMLSQKTIEATIRKLKFLERHGVNLMADEKTLKKQVMAHFAERRRAGVEGKTLNDYIKIINRWCRFRGFALKFKKYREYPSVIKIPLSSDIKALLDTCNKRTYLDKRDKTIIYFMSQSGLRREEVCNLNLDDIDWKNYSVRVKGKGGKERNVVLPWRVLHGHNVPSLKNYIKNWRLNTDRKALFTTKKGRLTPSGLQEVIKRRAIKAGLPWIHPHSLRHYYATNLLRAGINIRMVQYLLGHADIKTTGRYLHIVEQDWRQIINNPRIEDPSRIRRVQSPRKNRGVFAKSYLKIRIAPPGFLKINRVDFANNTHILGLIATGGGDFAKW